MTSLLLQFPSLVVSSFASVSPSVTVLEAIATRNQFNLDRTKPNHYLLVTEKEKLLGIITDEKLEELWRENQSLREVLVSEIMTTVPIVYSEEKITDLEVIIQIFAENNLDFLPIVNQKGTLTGLITEESLASVWLQTCRQKSKQQHHTSEKENTETHLAKTKQLFQQVQKMGKIGTWEYDLQTNRIEWSDEVYNIFGVKPDHFTPTYENFLNSIHPGDRHQMNQNYQTHLKTKIPYQVIHRLLLQDGQVKYVRQHCHTEFDPQGKPLKSLGTVQDVTEQTIAELTIKNIIQGTSTAISGQEFFENLVVQIALAVDQPCVVVSKIDGETLETLAINCNNSLKPNLKMSFKQTPCELVIKNGYYYCPQKVIPSFPQDPFLETVQAESYVGIALKDSNNKAIGIICVISNQPMTSDTIKKIKNILEVFASRAATELIRMESQEKLEKINLTLESKVQERTKQLQESKQFIKTILDTIPLPVFWKDAQGKYLGANAQFKEFVKVALEENIIGKNEQDLGLPPEQVQRYQQQDYVVMTTGESMLALEENITIQGEERWIESYKVPLKNSEEEIIGVLTIFKDITQEKAIQTALTESEARWQFALEGANHGVWDVNLRTNETFYSHKLIQMLGYEPQEWGNTVEDWAKRIHPDDREETLAIAEKYLKGEIPTYQTEHRLLCKDGSYRWILARGKFVEWDENDNPIRMIGTNTDITDRILMEEELRQSKNQFKRLVDEIGNKFVIFNHTLDNIVTYVSEGFSSIFGLTPDKILGQCWEKAINWTETALQDALNNVSLIINSPEIRFNEFEASFIHPSGEEKILRICHHTVKNEAGEIIAIEGILEDITTEKKALIALEESEKRFRQVFSSNVVGMMFTNHEGEILSANDRFLEMVGYSREDLDKGLVNWKKMTPPEYQDLDLQAIQQLRDNQRVEPWEKEYIRKDGSRISILIGVASLDPDHFNTVCVVIDITERKQAEKALREKTEELDRFFSLSLDLLCIANVEGYFIRLNRSWENILGYKIENLEHTRFLDLVHPDDIENTLEAIAHLKDNPELPFFVNRYRCRDGSYRWIEWRSASDGHLIYTAARDITDRLKSEKERQTLISALEKSNNLLQCISNAQSQFITSENRLIIFEGLLSSLLELTNSEYGFIGEVLFKDDGNAIMDESFLKIKGIPSLKSHSITNIAWDEESEKFYQENYQEGMEFTNMNTLFGAVVMTGKPVIANNPATDPHRGGAPEGHPPLKAFLGLPFFSENRLVGMVGIANRPNGYDQSIVEYLQPFLVTCSNLIEGYKIDRRRRQAEAELSLRNQELIKATRLKDQFLANMSHELRTPLNAILGNTEILREQVFGSLNERQLKSLATIESSSEHLLALINDVLDLAKIEAGQINLELIPTNIYNLSQSALMFVQQQAYKKGIQLESFLQEDLPNLFLDQRRIRQALINLLNNAVKFTPEGGKITLEVKMYAQRKKDWPANLTDHCNSNNNNPLQTFVRMAVIDTGIGIASENIEKLFKPFVQIDSELNRQYAGTGLGLSLVKEIAELHGGSVGVTSELGKGSCFYFDLPCHLAPSHLDVTILDQQECNYIEIQKNSSVILIAEDNESNILMMTDYLKAKGYQLLFARNGLEAIEVAKNQHPDLIIMDISMPYLDGLSAIAAIRQDEQMKNIPIIAATALTMEGDKQNCLNAGANDYISKPLRLRELVEKIENLLKQQPL